MIIRSRSAASRGRDASPRDQTPAVSKTRRITTRPDPGGVEDATHHQETKLRRARRRRCETKCRWFRMRNGVGGS